MDPFAAALLLYIGVSAVALLTAAATEPRVGADHEDYHARLANESGSSTMTDAAYGSGPRGTAPQTAVRSPWRHRPPGWTECPGSSPELDRACLRHAKYQQHGGAQRENGHQQHGDRKEQRTVDNQEDHENTPSATSSRMPSMPAKALTRYAVSPAGPVTNVWVPAGAAAACTSSRSSRTASLISSAGAPSAAAPTGRQLRLF